MTCDLCGKAITRKAPAHRHHVCYRSGGGSDAPENLVTVHAACHVRVHSERGEFQRWGREGGRVSSLDMRWLFTLKNVSTSPATAAARALVRIYTRQGNESGA